MDEAGKAVILKNDFGFKTLASCDLNWKVGETYQMELRLEGDAIQLSINGTPVLSVRDDSFDHGMFGCGSRQMGRTAFGNFTFQEL